METQKYRPNLPQDGVILRNLKRASYKMNVQSLDGARVTSVTSQDDYVFVALAGKGIIVFRIENGCPCFHHVTGCHESKACSVPVKTLSECPDVGVTCYELSASAKYLTYIKDQKGKLSVCIQSYQATISQQKEVPKQIEIARKAPLVVDHHLQLIIIGCAAWAVSWTSEESAQTTSDSNESHVRAIDLNTLETIREWKVADNSVALLRRQKTHDHNMLGVADTRTGLCVYDLNQPTPSEYVCLYQVPVEEIRNFHLAGNFVAVFHKFEPNVTFWNMKEQKTILCINIQDQMRELAEEFLEDDDEDCGLYGDDDDYVTSVTSVPSDEDFVLLYGTKSGCVFGMSVNNRLKLFNIPCPHSIPDSSNTLRRGIQGLRYITKGKLAVCYDNYGLTLLDFDLENPPDRPPTRCQKRV